MLLHRLLLDPRPSKTHEKKLPIWKEDLKTRFADLLFPGLLEDKPGVFFELLNAMAHERRLFKGEQKIERSVFECHNEKSDTAKLHEERFG